MVPSREHEYNTGRVGCHFTKTTASCGTGSNKRGNVRQTAQNRALTVPPRVSSQTYIVLAGVQRRVARDIKNAHGAIKACRGKQHGRGCRKCQTFNVVSVVLKRGDDGARLGVDNLDVALGATGGDKGVVGVTRHGAHRTAVEHVVRLGCRGEVGERLAPKEGFKTHAVQVEPHHRLSV